MSPARCGPGGHSSHSKTLPSIRTRGAHPDVPDPSPPFLSAFPGRSGGGKLLLHRHPASPGCVHEHDGETARAAVVAPTGVAP